MASYLDAYGAEDERRFRTIKRIVIAAVILVAVGLTAYLLLKNYREKQVIKHFLGQVNAGKYQAAYQSWGCTDTHPCPEYNYQKFMEDWGAKSNRNAWKISDVDGCPTGVIVTVSNGGSDSQPLWVQRSDKSISFSPWPECQGRQWRFRQFFRRIFGG
jgi:hypothetical protein